jgi:hypothetical protein
MKPAYIEIAKLVQDVNAHTSAEQRLWPGAGLGLWPGAGLGLWPGAGLLTCANLLLSLLLIEPRQIQ